MDTVFGGDATTRSRLWRVRRQPGRRHRGDRGGRGGPALGGAGDDTINAGGGADQVRGGVATMSSMAAPAMTSFMAARGWIGCAAAKGRQLTGGPAPIFSSMQGLPFGGLRPGRRRRAGRLRDFCQGVDRIDLRGYANIFARMRNRSSSRGRVHCEPVLQVRSVVEDGRTIVQINASSAIQTGRRAAARAP
jgi:hypothetical protein